MNTNKKIRILVVDDHPLSAQIVARLAVRAGMHAALAADGTDALNWLAEQQEPFDVVVSDVEMPRMGGFELLHEIRLRHGRLPVILMTAFFDEEKRDAARAWGAANLLKKPFGSRELTVAVNAALNGKHKPTVSAPKTVAVLVEVRHAA